MLSEVGGRRGVRTCGAEVESAREMQGRMRVDGAQKRSVTLAQPFSMLLLTALVAISTPDSALLVLLADKVSGSFRLVDDESVYIMFPAPPLPT